MTVCRREMTKMWRDPLSVESVEQNLRDAGCPETFVRSFLARYATSTPSEQMQMLHEQRERLLEQLHDSQKHLDCMDYLCYQIRKQSRTGRP